MSRSTAEETAPHLDTDPSARQVVPFTCVIQNGDLLLQLARIRAIGADWRTRWIAKCVESDEFHSQLDTITATLAPQGWEFVQLQGLEETPEGVRGQLVMEQRDSA